MMIYDRWTHFHTLANSFRVADADALGDYLPPDEQSLFKNASSPITALSVLLAASSPFEQVHYSWLLPIFEEIPKSLRSWTITSLPSSQQEKLAQSLRIRTLKKAPFWTQKELLGRLESLYNPEQVPPISAIEISDDLRDLLNLSKKQLIDLCHLLSMQDIAAVVRHIIDRTKLKRLYRFLSKWEREYLRICIHQKDRSGLPMLDIEQWDGQETAELYRILHHRGLVRLAKAMSGSGAPFIWHLTHKLDIGRGKIIAHHYEADEHPVITKSLRRQLRKLIKFIEKGPS